MKKLFLALSILGMTIASLSVFASNPKMATNRICVVVSSGPNGRVHQNVLIAEPGKPVITGTRPVKGGSLRVSIISPGKLKIDHLGGVRISKRHKC